MGEIADGLINGDFDSETGEYIGEGDGYPRTFENGNRKKQHNHIFGIKNFLRQKGESNWQPIIHKYAQENGWSIENKKIADNIQADFSAFAKWFKNLTQ